MIVQSAQECRTAAEWTKSGVSTIVYFLRAYLVRIPGPRSIESGDLQETFIHELADSMGHKSRINLGAVFGGLDSRQPATYQFSTCGGGRVVAEP